MHVAFIVLFLLGLAFWGYSVTIWRRSWVLTQAQQFTGSSARVAGFISAFIGFALVVAAFYVLTKLPGA
jgi:hypothetical protein